MILSTHGIIKPLAAFTNEYSLDFDGVNELVRVPADAALRPTAITISAWVNMDNIVTTQQIVRGIDLAAGANFGFSLAIGSSNATFFLRTSVPSNVGVSRAITSGTHHICGVYDGANIYIYVDGVSTSSALVTTPTYTPGDLIIGASSAAANFANGRIDEVSFFNTGMNSANVALLYNSGTPGNVAKHPFYLSNGVLWLRNGDGAVFDGTNWIIPDETGNGHTGTSANMGLSNRVAGL